MNDETKSLAVVKNPELLLPGKTETIEKLRAIREFQEVVKGNLKEGSDYGIIPGTDKPCLLQPGAQKIAKLLNLYEQFEVVEVVKEWEKARAFPMLEFPLFHYDLKCKLFVMGTGTQVGEGVGSCSSFEVKYRYRWIAEHDLPAYLDKALLKKRGGLIFEFGFAVDKAETSGKYGKPAEYWKRFVDAISKGEARASERNTRNGPRPGWEIDGTVYRIQNEDICDQINTIEKIAAKRAFVYANLSVARLSDLFTQDLEDRIDPGADHANGDIETTATTKKTVPVITDAHGQARTGEEIKRDPEPDPFDDEHRKLLADEEARRKKLQEQKDGLFGDGEGVPPGPTITTEQARQFEAEARKQKKTLKDMKAAWSVLKIEKSGEIPDVHYLAYMNWAKGLIDNKELARDVLGGGN